MAVAARLIAKLAHVHLQNFDFGCRQGMKASRIERFSERLVMAFRSIEDSKLLARRGQRMMGSRQAHMLTFSAAFRI
jgi:hypothetical protein